MKNSFIQNIKLICQHLFRKEPNIKKSLLTILAFIMATICLSQHKLEGKLVGSKTKGQVSNATLELTGFKIFTSSNKEGCFEFSNIKPGNYVLKITCIGYNDTIVPISISNDIFIEIQLEPSNTKINEVVVTANRQAKRIEEIPARVGQITPNEIKSYPATNIDNYLQAIPNVYVNRSWGIFSKNSSVTMRGMDGTARVLVLLDGVPLNHSAGGGINWHLLEPGQIEKIEVVKGPASALYGNNAMGGVINILTKNSEKKAEGNISLFGGTYNTLGGTASFGNNFVTNNKGFYWTGNIFYRQGKGYIIVKKEDRDSTDVPLGIKELGSNIKLGYQFNKNNKLEVAYNFYDDKRNEGTKIFEKEGSYLKYTTQNIRASYTGKIKGFSTYLNLFFHQQDYYQQSERLNSVGDTYKLYDRNQHSIDYGLWLNFSKEISKNNELSFGFDYKCGNFGAEDIYFTSTDYFERKGKIDFYGVFLQNDLQLFKQKFLISIGLRADMAQFKNGLLSVEDPTLVTAFDSQLSESFDETNWDKISPKLAISYKFNRWLRSYLSYSIGFMPPKIDDMVSSRKISNGFKVANPSLKPETLSNYEIGLDIFATDKIKLSLSTYYSIGNGFQYFVGTGDTVDIDRPVVKRDNISKVEIYGFETSINYQPANNININTNYTYNHSQIKGFELNYGGQDLSGKYISETPRHQVYCGIFFTNKIVDVSLATNYVSEMWQDELNTLKLEPYTTIDFGLRKNIKKISLSVDIQNILDKRYVDKKGGLSPGRFLFSKISIKL